MGTIDQELRRRDEMFLIELLLPLNGRDGKPLDRSVFDRLNDVDVEWWRSCRQDLERELDQEEILVRSLYVTKI